MGLDKKFQDCSKLVQIWRYRYYILIPFETLYYFLKSYFKGYKTNWRLHWGLSIGEAQIRMNWVYSSEEVFKKIR